VFPVDYVVARQRHGIDRLGKLHLEDHQTLPAERDFGAGEIHFPHPAEALVIDLPHAIAIALKPISPCPQGLGVMEPQNLDVGNPQF